MGWFTKTKEVEGKFHEVLSSSFTHIKKDVFHIFEWLKYFHLKHQEHDDRLAKIEQQITYMPKSHTEIKQIIDSYYSLDPLHQRIQELHRRIDELQNQAQNQKQEPRQTLKERLVQKITKNSKDYVKSVILSLIRKYQKITGPQLKEIVVEEQGLCSKSSFYRMLEELERENEIESIQSNKEKIYLPKRQIVN